MKMNPDCVRDILLAVEEETDGTILFEYAKQTHVPESLKKYNHNEILYHLRQCDLSGLIVGFTSFDCGNYILVGDLSPNGHEFLANIRSNGFWNKVKEAAIKIGTPALGSLIQIAQNLASELITEYFQLK